IRLKQIGLCQVLVHVAGKLHGRSIYIEHAPHKPHAISRKLMQIQRVSASVSADVRLAPKLRFGRKQLIDGLLIQAHQFAPHIGVLSPIVSRHTSRTAQAQVNLPSTLIQFLRNLRPPTARSPQPAPLPRVANPDCDKRPSESAESPEKALPSAAEFLAS